MQDKKENVKDTHSSILHKEEARIGVYPGTFDPITLGHLEIIERASSFLDHVVVGVAASEKKQSLFTLQERMDLVRKSLDKTTFGGRVSVCDFSTLLVSFCREKGARVIVRGLRTVADFEYEFQMASTNASLDANIETIFLLTSESKRFISSSIVKEVFQLGGDISHLVEAHVVQALGEKIKNI